MSFAGRGLSVAIVDARRPEAAITISLTRCGWPARHANVCVKTARRESRRRPSIHR
jgi:hypothetical protein